METFKTDHGKQVEILFEDNMISAVFIEGSRLRLTERRRDIIWAIFRHYEGLTVNYLLYETV